MNPTSVVHNGIKYNVVYDRSFDVINSFSVIDPSDGEVVAEEPWDSKEDVLEGDVFGALEDAGIHVDFHEEEFDPIVGFDTAEMESKLGDIVRLLKKIEKNTRK